MVTLLAIVGVAVIAGTLLGQYKGRQLRNRDN